MEKRLPGLNKAKDVPFNAETVMSARENFADILSRTRYAHTRTRITRHGKPVAAIISIEDLELLEALEDQMDLKLVARARKEIKRGEVFDWDAVKAELGL